MEREVEKYGYRGGVKRDRPKRVQKKREKAEAAMEKAEVEAEGEKRAVVERAVERQMSQTWGGRRDAEDGEGRRNEGNEDGDGRRRRQTDRES